MRESLTTCLLSLTNLHTHLPPYCQLADAVRCGRVAVVPVLDPETESGRAMAVAALLNLSTAPDNQVRQHSHKIEVPSYPRQLVFCIDHQGAHVRTQGLGQPLVYKTFT